jgi:leucyl aminopeptidase
MNIVYNKYYTLTTSQNIINAMKKINYTKEINIIDKKNNNLNNTKYNIQILFINSIDNIDSLELSYAHKIMIKNILEKKEFNPHNETYEIISLINENNEEVQYGIIGIKDETNKSDYESIKNNFGKILNFIQSKKIKSVQIQISESIFRLIDADLFAEILQSTLLLKIYHFNTFITDSKKLLFTNFGIDIVVENHNYDSIKKGLEKGRIVGSSINFSRYLSDLPAKELYPESFIDIVKEKCSQINQNISITNLNSDQLIKLGMGGILGVGQGSAHTPALLILQYTPSLPSTKTVALVGKGVTFDTGGISIKPSDGMEDMKSDMSGAAAVASALIGLAQLESPYTIYAITPLAENMVDGNSIRPGDILQFYNGKTAEIKNTDAEGRLILADALSYTCDTIKPDIIIDLATLTGACRIALGPVYAGLMTENTSLECHIKEAGKKTGNRCWPLPLEKAYEINMHSDVADMCNIGTKGYKAGATMGGMFLREFVDPKIAWAHIDIAPVATDCPFKSYIHSFGATGFGVELLIELLKDRTYLQ